MSAHSSRAGIHPEKASRRGGSGLQALGGLLLAGSLILLTALPALARLSPEAPEGPRMATPPPQPPFRDHAARVDRAGERIFFSRAESPIPIACADCHQVTPEGTPATDDLIRPGHSLFDAFDRGNWWNGRITTDAGEAGEVCLKRFMGGKEMSGPMRTRLVVYMKSLAAPYATPFVLRRMPPGHVDASSGDRELGEDLFRRACQACHPGGGEGLGPDLAASTLTAREIADLLRTGSDPMPFYQTDILSDQEVAHISAFTRSLQPSGD